MTMVPMLLSRLSKPVLLFLFCLACVQPAVADVITLDAFSGSETLIDFTGLSTPSTADPLVFGNLTVDSNVSNLQVTDAYGPFAETPQASQGMYLGDLVTSVPSEHEMQFLTPISRLGMWANGGNSDTSWMVTAYDAAGGLVGAHVFTFVSVSYPDPSTFIGIEFAQPFKRVTIVEGGANGQYTSFDDIRFELVGAPVVESSWSALKSRF